ncbi:MULTISPECIES: hypothetical protein [unclassified Streptomyces]|uniref:hypothetical protein n=1 Tax=Streptomyces sp. NPDC055082 TaxID=3365718 RepID=UPI0037D8232A
MSDYMHRSPDETVALAPFWEALAQHAKAGACHHRGTCPIVVISPIIVDERHRVLMLRSSPGRPPILPEAGLVAGFETLEEASSTLARALGVWKPLAQPGLDGPIQLHATTDKSQGDTRTKVSVRYLYRTASSQCAFVVEAPQIWVPLTEVDTDLARRVSGYLVARA